MASVIGRDFTLAALERAAGPPSPALSPTGGKGEEGIEAHLEEAVRVGVLEERSQVGGVRYRFSHAFFRQSLYEEISAARRIRLHQQVGQALETLYKGRISEHAAELAEHFSHSSDPADLAKAVQYGEAAAQRAVSVFDHGEALRLLERAIDVQEVLDPDDKAKRCDLLLALGEALMPAGNPKRAYEDVAEKAFALAQAGGNAIQAADASVLALRAARRSHGNVVYGSPLYKVWVDRALASSPPESPQRIWALNAQAYALRVALSRFREAESVSREALQLADRLQDTWSLWQIGTNVISTVRLPGEDAYKLDIALKMLKSGPERLSRADASEGYFQAGRRLLCHGYRAEAEAAWRKGTDIARGTRDPFQLVMALQVQASLSLAEGRLEAVLAAEEEWVLLADQAGMKGGGFLNLTAAPGVARVLLGRLEGIGDYVDRISANPFFNNAFRAQRLGLLGQTKAAAALLEDAVIGRRVGSPDDQSSYQFLAVALEAALVLRDAPKVGLLSKLLAGAADMSTVEAMVCTPARLLGAASAFLGDHALARAYYAQALDAAGKIRFRPEIALTRLSLAELLLDHYPKERAEAMGHLDFAIGEFRDMKMQPSLERALKRKEILKA